MKKRSIRNLLAVLLLIGCSNADKKDKANDSNDSTANGTASQAGSLLTGCYRQIIDRDSIVLNITERNGTVTGTAAFKNYQKDSSRGTVKGKRENGQLVLLYEFFSEGMNSVMELVFKPAPDGMIKGSGELVNRGDTVVFKNKTAIAFPEQDKLIRIKCAD
jgi:hypothetical protein